MSEDEVPPFLSEPAVKQKILSIEEFAKMKAEARKIELQRIIQENKAKVAALLEVAKHNINTRMAALQEREKAIRETIKAKGTSRDFGQEAKAP